MARSRHMAWIGSLALVIVLSGGSMAGEQGDGELARRLTDLGIAAQLQADHEAALAYFERARRDVDHPKIRYFQAKSLDALGRYSEALAGFRALKNDREMGKYAGEIQAYIRAIVAEREQARLAARLAEIERSCGSVPSSAEPTGPEQRE